MQFRIQRGPEKSNLHRCALDSGVNTYYGKVSTNHGGRHQAPIKPNPVSRCPKEKNHKRRNGVNRGVAGGGIYRGLGCLWVCFGFVGLQSIFRLGLFGFLTTPLQPTPTPSCRGVFFSSSRSLPNSCHSAWRNSTPTWFDLSFKTHARAGLGRRYGSESEGIKDWKKYSGPTSEPRSVLQVEKFVKS